MKKYIDADKLKAEIKIIQQSLEHRDVRFNQVKKIRAECMMEFCKCIFDVIDSLQQEQQPEYVRKDIVVDAIKFVYGKLKHLKEYIKSNKL